MVGVTRFISRGGLSMLNVKDNRMAYEDRQAALAAWQKLYGSDALAATLLV